MTVDSGLPLIMERFAFGKNWEKYVDGVREQDYFAAKTSLKELTPNLKGKSFLDVGCGSGLFSISAGAMGAAKVSGFDLDPDSVEASRKLLEKVTQWEPDLGKEKIEFRVESILNDDIEIEPYDVVYSWGVLHHTGEMYRAFDAVTKLVADKGTLVIAIYNRHFTSPIWRFIKHLYVKSPGFLKTVLVFLVMMVKLPAVMVLSRKNPFKDKRGMHYWTDIVDWVGGYPYEYASTGEVTEYFNSRGFTLTKLIPTKGFTGCNQFVFEKTG